MSSRATVAQQPPAPGLDLSRFPDDSAGVHSDMYSRAHTKPYDAHWRSSSGEGRFDLPAPEGTCYVAETTEVAVREWLGPAGTKGFATQDDCDRLQVTIFDHIACRAALVSVPAAAPYGITSELTTMTPYDTPQAWARALRAAGFEAIRYAPRFTPGGAPAVALFGPAGAGKVGEELRRIDGPEAMAIAGITVLPTPPASRLTVI